MSFDPLPFIPLNIGINDATNAYDVPDTPFTDREDPGAILPAVPIPDPQEDPCFKFPVLTLPRFTLPVFQLPNPHCCSKTQGPIIDIGAMAGQIGSWLSAIPRPDLKFDKTDPKFQRTPGMAVTLIGTPAEPPHVSVEAYKVIPNVALELLGGLVSNVVLAVGTTISGMGGILGALKAKADALGDQAAKAMGNGLATILASPQAIGNMADEASRAVWMSLNLATGMLPMRQIPVNGWNPITAKQPQMEWYNDGQLRSKWPNNGGQHSPLEALNNGVNIVKDIFNASGAMCIVNAAVNLFAGAANALARGLGALSWGMQLEGMIRNFSVLPFHIEGMDSLLHDWRHWCKLKVEWDGFTGPQLDTRSGIFDAIDDIFGCKAAGALPGNLIHAADAEGDFDNIGSLQMIGPAIGTAVGSPHVESLRKYVSDPDPKYDGLTSSLPDLFKAGDPRMRKLIEGMLAFQEVLLYIKSLLVVEVEDLRRNATQVGGGFVDFVLDVRRDADELGDLNKLSVNFNNNRFTTLQHDLTVALAGQWDDLNVDTSVINDFNRKTVVNKVLDPRDILGGGRLSDLLNEAPAILDNFGGPVGPEVAYAASVHCGMTRCLLVLNTETPEQDRYDRTKTILKDTAEHAKEMTYGGPTRDWVIDMAATAQGDVGFDGLARASLPGAAKSTQQAVNHLERTSSALTTMMAQHNGKDTLADLSQPANDIDHEAENSDTINFTAAAQKNAREAQRDVLTKSLPIVLASAKSLELGQVSDKAADMSSYVERMIQEQANAQAMASLTKVTGTRLNQSYEGSVNQAKFILNQAGHTMTFDAPWFHAKARVLTLQGGVTLHEADSYAVRARWTKVVSRELISHATTDYAVSASGKLTQMADTAKHVSRKGIEILDALKLVQAVGGVPGNPVPTPPTVQRTMEVAGNDKTFASQKVQITAGVAVEVFAGTEVKIHVGACQIMVSPTRIDLNPLIPIPPAPVTPSPVSFNYTEAPSMDTTSDKGVGLLPSQKGRNPVPCAAPYNDPGVSGLMG